MLYGKKNYWLIAISVATIILGFALMSGGGSTDPNEFNPKIFSTRRTVVAPLVCLAGFLLMIYAIIAKPEHVEQEA